MRPAWNRDLEAQATRSGELPQLDGACRARQLINHHHQPAALSGDVLTCQVVESGHLGVDTAAVGSEAADDLVAGRINDLRARLGRVTGSDRLTDHVRIPLGCSPGTETETAHPQHESFEEFPGGQSRDRRRRLRGEADRTPDADCQWPATRDRP